MAGRICVAKIGAVHGVRGEVRLFAFTEDPLAVGRYGLLEDARGARTFKIASLRPGKDHLIARFDGVENRDAAAKLTNLELYVPRERLPEIDEQDSYYHADLVGLRVETPQGRALGTVLAVRRHGGGDLLEIAPAGLGESVMLPFVGAFVRQVDIESGKIVADPPGGLFDFNSSSRPSRAKRGASRDP